MSARAGHLGEAIQDLLDGRRGEAERAQAQAHLQACPRCRREFESLRQVKEAVATRAARQPVPAHLSDAIAETLDREDLRARAVTSHRRSSVRPKLRWALGFGFAAMAAFVSVLLWFARAPARLPAAVAQDFVELHAGRLLLEARTTEPRDLERWFASRRTAFETHVYDLAMMDYKLAGGSVHRTQGRPSTLFAYEGPGGAQLLCVMYKGRLDELPAATETLEHNGISFRVYHRKNGLAAVFWQEGEVICVLVSDIAAHDVIQFAFSKASRVPP